MTNVPLAVGDWDRDVAQAPAIRLKNRYFEQTPDPEHGPVSLIARPALRRFVSGMGTGPVRGLYSEQGTFADNLFAVSGDNLYRVDALGAASDLGAISSGGTASVRFAATPNLSPTPEYLFLAEGGVLWVFIEDGQALGLLQASGNLANGDVVEVGGIYYEFTNGSVDAGTPDGSLSDPWLVNFTGVNSTDLETLYHAINDTGVDGTDYSTALDEHPTALAYSVAANDLFVAARELGTNGNAITTTETGANMAWGSATLTGGGDDMLRQVNTPDSVGIAAVAQIAGYVLCICAQGEGVNGRYYWIEPGEIEINALNFATAERAPDPCHSARVIGDQFWLLGTSSLEPWYLTGLDAAPFARQQSRVFDRGVWEGSDVQVKDIVLLVDQTDGTVYAVGGQGPVRVSTHSVEERVREAMATQRQKGF